MSLELHVTSATRDAGWEEERREALRHQMQSRVHSGWEWRDCVPGDIMRRWAKEFRWLALVSVLWRKNEDYIKVGSRTKRPRFVVQYEGLELVLVGFERDPRWQSRSRRLETCSRV